MLLIVTRSLLAGNVLCRFCLYVCVRGYSSFLTDPLPRVILSLSWWVHTHVSALARVTKMVHVYVEVQFAHRMGRGQVKVSFCVSCIIASHLIEVQMWCRSHSIAVCNVVPLLLSQDAAYKIHLGCHRKTSLLSSASCLILRRYCEFLFQDHRASTYFSYWFAMLHS